MPKIYFKWGLMAVIILQIASILFLVNIYNRFSENPDNFYKNILTEKSKTAGKSQTPKIIESDFN